MSNWHSGERNQVVTGRPETGNRPFGGQKSKTVGSLLALALTSGALVGSCALTYAADRNAVQQSAGTMSTNKTTSAQPSISAQATRKMIPNVASLPMFFEPNQGQSDPKVKFLSRGSGYGLFLTNNEAILTLQKPVFGSPTATPLPEPNPVSMIRMKLEGADGFATVAGTSEMPGKSNYFIGNDRSKWRTNVPQFAKVQYQQVYPGIDLVYYGNQGQLEYDFRVSPGADPNKIALAFSGASVRIDSDSGDLVLGSSEGDIRFHAPKVYQPSVNSSRSGSNQSSSADSGKLISAGFRKLADNRIGFAIGDYDHSRELVIDPILSYSTFLGGGGEYCASTVGPLVVGCPKVAIDSADDIYLAGSTTTAFFNFDNVYEGRVPYQGSLNGAQNIFIAVITASPSETGGNELLYATYLGGDGTDSLAGIAVDQSDNIYVAGTTNSTNFPTTANAFQQTPLEAGTHGFVTALTLNSTSVANYYGLTYSTYLSGNATDTLTGMAIDQSCLTQTGAAACNVYLTGITNSSNGPNNGFVGFPSNAEAYQSLSNSPGNAQFFASKLYTAVNGVPGMLYSTYFGGGNFGTTNIAIGGGVAVDPTTSAVNMYFTGTTNQLGYTSGNLLTFPLLNAEQLCLNEAEVTGNCASNSPTTTPDAFAAKINPNVGGQASLLFSTYIGGSGNDYGNAIAVDNAANVYVAGATNSPSICTSCPSGFQATYPSQVDGADNNNGFLAKIGPLTGSIYPMTYFSWLGGIGPDSIQAVTVNINPISNQSFAYLVGTTNSSDFPITTQDSVPNGSTYNGSGDAFVTAITTSTPGTFPTGTPAGDFSTFLGGSGIDQATGVAIDQFGNTYVAGTTTSTNFPVTANALQGTLVKPQNAFVSVIGPNSQLVISADGNPTPYPIAPAGEQITFKFNILNNGPDNANLVNFTANGIPVNGLTKPATAQIDAGTGSCNSTTSGGTISCTVANLVAGATAIIEVDVTPSIPIDVPNPLNISAIVSANNNGVTYTVTQPSVDIADFYVKATPLTPTVNAGDTAQIQVQFCGQNSFGYNGTITPSQSTSPSMVTAATPTFNPTSVSLVGGGQGICGSTTLSIATVARPVNSGTASIRHQVPFYATWLPIGGISLLGLGLASDRKRRGWILVVLFCVVLGIIMILPSCGTTSTAVTTPTGTQAGTYIITVTGTSGTGASHQTTTQLQVN